MRQAAVIATVLASGCAQETPSSAGVATGALIGWFQLRTDGTSAAVTASFTTEDSGTQSLLLGSGDRILCNGQELTSAPGPAYAGQIPDVEEDGAFRFQLVREDRQETIAIEVPPPPRFALAPLPSTLKIGFPVTVTWAPSGTTGVIDVSVVADCLRSLRVRSLPDTGRALVGPLDPVNGVSAEFGCRGSVTVERRHPGRPTSVLKAASSSTTFEQVRSAIFEP